MILSEFKRLIKEVDQIDFQLENGELVPSHYHITEVGQINKHFIDCGGTIRNEHKISFQLYTAEDFDHRLKAQKMLSIVELSENKLNLQDCTIEVEYQSNTIGKYNLDFNGQHFVLRSTHTDCLAKDNCGIPEKKKVSLADLNKEKSACTPGGGCC